ncbi:hypothetical protein MEA186_24987 [Mesorhizobium amorphae CCNWGS0123]|uniref:Uncharacterized protein n=1 Tax=Mesorhizobium amorphae CCNWGS0123 TaxID=1082933 RepID=G6YG89_9HYPH|nr:hypothetical protein MEA186_24987 [Mesorhizobium amorphae CCNWGS0123]
MPAIFSDATIASSDSSPFDDGFRCLGPEFRRNGKQPVGAALELGGQIDGAQRSPRLGGEQTLRTVGFILGARHRNGS